MSLSIQLICGGLLVLVVPAASAQTYYKCTQPDGTNAYQETPCGAKSVRKSEYYFEPVASAEPRPEQARLASATPVVASFKKHLNSPTINVSHDPTGLPARLTVGEADSAIRQALDKWNQRCNVNFVFRGSARDTVLGKQSAETGYTVRWDTVLRDQNGTKLGGYAGTGIGVLLSSSEIKSAAQLRNVAAHELGHVLGMQHVHEDTQSIMSYLRHRGGTGELSFSETDYINCNLAMAARFGIPYEKPAGTKDATMSDAEALRAMNKAAGR